MTEGKKVTSWLPQLLAAVAVALIAGGTSPWWWRELFGDDSNRAGRPSGGSTTQKERSEDDAGGSQDTFHVPSSDFPSGSTPVYSANFSSWPTNQTEHGVAKPEFGSYTLRAYSSTWVGPGRTIDITPLTGDFVLDVRFRVEEGWPSLSVDIFGTGEAANCIETYLGLRGNQDVVYSLQKCRLQDRFYRVTEETVVDLKPLPPTAAGHDWSKTSKVTLKRTKNTVQFFVNNGFVYQFPMAVFPVSDIGIGIAGKSRVVITSVEVRIRLQ